jgi:hypothetical protein
MKRLISVAISIFILSIIYSKINFYELVNIFKNCHFGWMTASIGLLIPITLITAWRLQVLMPQPSSLGLIEANRLILGASVLNMILPSKMGEVAKAYFMRDRGHLTGSLALSLVIFERACDMLSLLFLCFVSLLIYPLKGKGFWSITIILGLLTIFGIVLVSSKKFTIIFFRSAILISPPMVVSKIQKLKKSWLEMHQYFYDNLGQLLKVIAISLFLWILHLLQVWLFILALRQWVPFFTNLALAPLAILAGLLPITFAGIGTRDAAITYLYSPYFSASVAAALGILCTSRYFLQAIVGLPFLNQILLSLKRSQKIN